MTTHLTLSGSETIGLYNMTGTLLASTSVSTSGVPVDGYLFAGITPVALVDGQQYTVVAQTGPNPWAYGTVNSAPGITFNYDDYLYGSTLSFTTTPGGSGPAYMGPNLAFVPEPGFNSVLALGLVGLAYGVRARRKTQKA
jgi:hypothetical protein